MKKKAKAPKRAAAKPPARKKKTAVRKPVSPNFAALDEAILETSPDAAVEISRQEATPAFRKYLVERAGATLDEFVAKKAKAREQAWNRFRNTLVAMSVSTDAPTKRFLKQTLERQEELAPLKIGSHDFGRYVVRDVAVQFLLHGTKADFKRVAQSHKSIDALGVPFVAAAWSMSPKWVFDEFSPYLLSKSKRFWADVNREVCEKMVRALAGGFLNLERLGEEGELCYEYPVELWTERFGVRNPKLDSRWLDAAIEVDELLEPRLSLIDAVFRPGYAPLNDYLRKKFEALLKESWDCHYLLNFMIEAEFPEVLDCLLRAAEKIGVYDRTIGTYYIENYAGLMAELPAHAGVFDKWILGLKQKGRRDHFARELKACRAWRERQARREAMRKQRLQQENGS